MFLPIPVFSTSVAFEFGDRHDGSDPDETNTYNTNDGLYLAKDDRISFVHKDDIAKLVAETTIGSATTGKTKFETAVDVSTLGVDKTMHLARYCEPLVTLADQSYTLIEDTDSAPRNNRQPAGGHHRRPESS